MAFVYCCKCIKQRIFNGLTLTIVFIQSWLWVQDFFYIFTSTKHDTKYKQILSNAGDKFDIKSQNIEFSLVIEKCSFTVKTLHTINVLHSLVIFTLWNSHMAIEQWGFLAYYTYCDTGHLFIIVNSEDPWHSHLLPSVLKWSCHYLFLRYRSVEAWIQTPNLPNARPPPEPTALQRRSYNV